MIRNTRDLISVFKIWLGGIALFSAGLLGIILNKGIHRLRCYHRKFNSESVEEISGKIIEVFSRGKNANGTQGTVLLLAGERETIKIHLGPSWFIERQFKPLVPGEQVDIKGSRITYKGEEIIVAEILRRGRHKYRLRDENGLPFWHSKVDETAKESRAGSWNRQKQEDI